MKCYSTLRKRFLYAIFIIRLVTASKENNCSNDTLMSSFSCPSPDTCSLLAPNVCITSDYDPSYKPNVATLDTATIVFKNIRLLNVNEKKKDVTLDLEVFMIWKDDRIKVLQNNSEYTIILHQITNENDEPSIWTPLRQLSIVNLRNRGNLDGRIMTMALFGKDSMNKLFTSDNFLGNASDAFVFSHIEWGLTIWCSFNFSRFPFDTHVCPVAMRFRNIHVNFADQEVMYFLDYAQKMADGFMIKVTKINPMIHKHPKLEVYWNEIGFEISMKRQISKYIYQYYIPCIAIVITSGFSFIIPLSAIPGRVSLVVTLFLTLTNIFIVQMVGCNI